MNLLSRIWSLWRSGGVAGILRLARKRIKSRTPYLLLEHTWSDDVATAFTPDAAVLYRPAGRKDVPGILDAWPAGYVPGFTADWENPAARQGILEDRFARNLPCFLGIERATGRVLCGVWCVPWEYDAVLPADLKGRPAFEVSAAFSRKDVRGQFSITGNLIRYAMREMAGSRGIRVGYARSQSLKRAHSALALRSFGARKLGYLIHGVSWGRPYARLVPDLPESLRNFRRPRTPDSGE